jgi:hypothetical protein
MFNLLKSYYLRERLTQRLIFLLLIITIFYFLFPRIIYGYFISPIEENNQIYLFGDWSVIISAINCKFLDYNIFVNNPCDVIERKHVYGSILLFIPYFEKYSKFYFLYFPIIVNFIFIFVVISHFTLKSLKEYILVLFFIFNPATILLMERLNFDIFIFLLIILLCYYRKNLLNLFIILFLSLSKFYPLSLFPLFFINNNNILKNLIYALIFLFLFLFFLYLDKENLAEILNNTKQFSADYFWSFNFFALSKIPILLTIFSKIFLVVFSLLFFLIFFLIGFFIYKNVLVKKEITLNNVNSYNKILFLMSSGVLVSSYFIFNNWIYREVFLFGIIPFLLELSAKEKFFNNLINLIILRFAYFSISNYFSFFKGNDFLLIFHQIFDIFLISFFLGIIFHYYLSLVLSVVNLKKYKKFYGN